MKTPRRPVLRWHGGKWRLAPFVIQHFPPHRIYVEPFGGAASVLLRKPRSYSEVYNDLDHQAVNLFRVLRDPDLAASLIAQLQLTPYARAEFESCVEATDDPVEKARRLIVRSFMGFGSNAHSSSPVAEKNGFKSHTRPARADWRCTGFRSNSNRSHTTPAHDWANYPPALKMIIDRLRGVVIESRDAFSLLPQHDGVDTLFYLDPPYLPETRSPANKYDLKHRMYRHELTRDQHAELLEVARDLEGMVLISGYPSDLYDHALSGWRRIETDALADGARKRTEVLWISPSADRAMAPFFSKEGAAA